MSKSIESIVLATAKKRETFRLHLCKENFLTIIDAHFQKLLKDFKTWEAIDNHPYKYAIADFPNAEFSDLKIIAEKLGFILNSNASQTEIYLSVPKWTKGETRTEAQKMLFHFEKELNRRIKEEKAKANEEYRMIIEKLRYGHFASCKHTYIGKGANYYLITVNKSSCANHPNSIFLEQLANLLKKRKFYNLSEDLGNWTFHVTEK